MARKKRGPSKRDRAEVARGGGSYRDRKEVAVMRRLRKKRK